MTTDNDRPDQVPVLRWWWVTAAALAGLATTLAILFVLLKYIGSQADSRIVSNQLDSIRTALSIALGTGGGIALWLTARRQRSTELQIRETRRIADMNLAQSDRIASRSEIDLRERRITDSYSKAVELLGSENAPARLGGLYALERLAQDHQPDRQMVANVICAYLQMPFSVPAGIFRKPDDSSAGQIDDGANAELRVRLAAQNILIRNLQKNPPESSKGQWEEIDIDLSCAELIDFRLERCRLRRAKFDYARFHYVARFDETSFADDVQFFNTEFYSCNAFFPGVKFGRRAIFTDVRFGHNVSFRDCAFGSAAFYRNAFHGRVNFDEAYFVRIEGFEGSQLLAGDRSGGFTFKNAILNEPLTNPNVEFPNDWRVIPNRDGRFTFRLATDR